MKILHVITSLRTGGAEKLMVDLLPRLKEAGHQVDLLLFDGIETPFKKEIEQKGIRIFELGSNKSVYSVSNLFKLIPFLRKYDIIHTHNYAPQLFSAIAPKTRNIKLITTEHNTSNRRRKYKLFSLIDRWMYNRYDKVICISQKAENNLRNFIGKSQAGISTINNGIDVEKYARASQSPDLEKIAPKSRKIIMVAAFRWEKDQPTLIKALKHLPEIFHLFLVGDGSRRPEFEELVQSLGLENRVHFMGIRNDIPQLLHAADYIVMSSHFEGLSLSSVEGMSVGKPFLASDVDGLREVVNGAGILFEHGSANDLADKIKDLEDNATSYREISEQCYARAKRFDISKMADGYLTVYGNP